MEPAFLQGWRHTPSNTNMSKLNPLALPGEGYFNDIKAVRLKLI